MLYLWIQSILKLQVSLIVYRVVDLVSLLGLRSTQQYATSYACSFKKLYTDPYPPSVHLSVSPLRSIETVFIANAHGDYYS